MSGIVSVLALLAAASAAAQTPAAVAANRAAAALAASRGQWRQAETSQRLALDACRDCVPEDRAILRAELAGYLTLGGFPQAAVALWKHSLAELPPGSPELPAAHIGLGVALYTAGHREDAQKAWKLACFTGTLEPLAAAACRFNVAVARMDAGPIWSELEEVLPTILAAPGASNRATALLQTAAAALAVGRHDRAGLLIDQAEAVVTAELDPRHPFLAIAYALRARLADARGDARLARSWRKKAAAIPNANGWNSHTVSIDDLKEKPRP